MRKLLFFLCILVFMSCSTLPQKHDYYTPLSYTELGVVGKKQKSVHKTDFTTIGIPKYEDKVRLRVIEKVFTKSIFNKYKKANHHKKTTTNIVYNDSIQPKPTYLNIEIEDKVSVVETLNKQTSIFNYLKRSPRATLVAGLQIIPSATFTRSFKKADAVYLQTDAHTKQWFVFYKKGKMVDRLDLTKSTLFGYKLASFCWEASSRRKIRIATLVDEGSVCTSMTKRNPEKLEQELTKSSFEF